MVDGITLWLFLQLDTLPIGGVTEPLNVQIDE
jgi:hypothetical protein